MSLQCMGCLKIFNYEERIFAVTENMKDDFESLTLCELDVDDSEAYMCLFCMRSLQMAIAIKEKFVATRVEEYVRKQNGEEIENPAKRRKYNKRNAEKYTFEEEKEVIDEISQPHSSKQLEMAKKPKLSKSMMSINLKKEAEKKKKKKFHVAAVDKPPKPKVKHFRCLYCEKYFTTCGGRTKHVKVIHQKVRFPCTVDGCKKMIKRKDQFISHLSYKHKDLTAEVKEAAIEKFKTVEGINHVDLDKIPLFQPSENETKPTEILKPTAEELEQWKAIETICEPIKMEPVRQIEKLESVEIINNTEEEDDSDRTLSSSDIDVDI